MGEGVQKQMDQSSLGLYDDDDDDIKTNILPYNLLIYGAGLDSPLLAVVHPVEQLGNVGSLSFSIADRFADVPWRKSYSTEGFTIVSS